MADPFEEPHIMPDQTARLNDRFVAQARTFSRVASLLVMVVGALALSGWIFDAAILKGFGGSITMKANAAVALSLAGVSSWLLHGGTSPVWSRRVGLTCAAVVSVIGIATLSEHVIGWNLGIDQLLFTEEPGALATTSPGRMGPPASTCFALAGVALILLHRGRLILAGQLIAIAIGLVALLAITGYLYNIETLYGVARYTGIAAHTATALFLLSAAMLAGSIDRGVGSVMANEAAGSLMARRLLVFAVAGPLLLGWVRLWLEERGYFDSRFGVAALVLAIIVILSTVILRTAARLNSAEQQKLATEAKLRDRLHEIETVMEVLPIGLFITTDSTGKQIVGNRAAREFLRIPEPAGNLSPSASAHAMPPNFRVLKDGVEIPPEDLPVQRAVREGVPVKDMELEVVFDDGTSKYEVVTALPLLDEKGRPRGAVASMMDITARRMAEWEREHLLIRESQARAEAEAANQAKDQFLATVSHELRTPLNAILGWVSILRDRMIDDPAMVSNALETIERNCRTQAQLIEDLLDVSRIIEGKLLLDVKPVDLVSMIRVAADAVRPAADARRIQVGISVTPAAIHVRGDPTRLQQVVWNLLSNAVKFSNSGGSVEVRMMREDGDAVVTVADAGEGIDPEFLPHVFDRFRQADGRKTRRFSGLGLGLSIARSLVEMHGGTIQAASGGIGQGATFTVHLPLFAEPAGDVIEPATPVGTDLTVNTAADQVLLS